jgi:hypothetical protein
MNALLLFVSFIVALLILDLTGVISLSWFGVLVLLTSPVWVPVLFVTFAAVTALVILLIASFLVWAFDK